MSGIANALRHELRDPEYSEGYAESFLNSYIATQIKVLREQRQMSQPQLAALIGTSQPGISRIENVNYSSWNIGTLKKLARAFNVRLNVSFEPYGTLPDEVEDFSRSSLQRPSRENDPGLSDGHIEDIRISAAAIVLGNVEPSPLFSFHIGNLYTPISETNIASFAFSNAPIDTPQASSLVQQPRDESVIDASTVIQRELAKAQTELAKAA